MISKRTTYPLLAVALVLWGVIAYKLFRTEEPQALIPAVKPSDSPGSAAPDTLRADYRDPFLGKMPQAAQKPTATWVKPPTPPAATKEKTAVLFGGLVRRQQTVYYLISLDGRQHMLRPGESAEGFVLEKAAEDSITLKKNTHTYTAKRP